MASLKNQSYTGAQLSRALIAFSDDPGSISRVHMAAHTSVTLVPGVLILSSDLHRQQVHKCYTVIHSYI